MSMWGDFPRRDPLVMADLRDGLRVRHTDWNATGTIERERSRVYLRFDETRNALEVSPRGPVFPSQLEIVSKDGGVG